MKKLNEGPSKEACSGKDQIPETIPRSIFGGVKRNIIYLLGAVTFLGATATNQGCHRGIQKCNSSYVTQDKGNILGRVWRMVINEPDKQLQSINISSFLKVLLGDSYKIEDTGNKFSIVKVGNEGSRCEVPLKEKLSTLPPNFLERLYKLVKLKKIKIPKEYIFKYVPPKVTTVEGGTKVTNCSSKAKLIDISMVKGIMRLWRNNKTFFIRQKRPVFFSPAGKKLGCGALKSARDCLEDSDAKTADEIIKRDCNK